MKDGHDQRRPLSVRPQIVRTCNPAGSRAGVASAAWLQDLTDLVRFDTSQGKQRPVFHSYGTTPAYYTGSTRSPWITTARGDLWSAASAALTSINTDQRKQLDLSPTRSVMTSSVNDSGVGSARRHILSRPTRPLRAARSWHGSCHSVGHSAPGQVLGGSGSRLHEGGARLDVALVHHLRVQAGGPGRRRRLSGWCVWVRAVSGRASRRACLLLPDGPHWSGRCCSPRCRHGPDLRPRGSRRTSADNDGRHRRGSHQLGTQ